MEGMPLIREETRPRNAGKFIIICICKEIAVSHMLGRHLILNSEFAIFRERPIIETPLNCLQPGSEAIEGSFWISAMSGSWQRF